jgi:ABC-type Fe3+/spermidine/putrescine transport system ATPase subunit
MSYLNIERLDKTFARLPGDKGSRIAEGGVHVVNDLSIAVEEGEIVALLGASGSGKTTLLRCIGGLETPDAGTISVAGKPLFSAKAGVNEPPHRRNMGMVFQSYALWPHMSVAQNVGYPLVRRRMPAADVDTRVRQYLDLVDCAALAGRYPHQLSGGQQQRVALARALVAEPSLVLFDEPLSNLDANLREQLRFQIRELKRRIEFTGVYVTHDHAEAIFIADRIAIIRDGCLLQMGSADQLYDAPASSDVADFLGFTNTLGGRVEGGKDAADGTAALITDAGRLSVLISRIHDRESHDDKFVMKCHPSRTQIETAGISSASAVPGLSGRVVDRVRVSADSTQYVVDIGTGITWQCTGRQKQELDIGTAVVLNLAPEHLHLFRE